MWREKVVSLAFCRGPYLSTFSREACSQCFTFRAKSKFLLHTHTRARAPDMLSYHAAVGGAASLCHSAPAQHLASGIVSICELANRHLVLMPKSTILSFGGRKTLLKIIVPGSTGPVPKAVRCSSARGGLGRSTLQPDASISCPINPE